jgi:conjugative relaxase-like TrwC/TraI family protein
MLTAKPQLNLASAREYFREHLSTGDYYAQGQKVSGEWFGKGAENLGLKGKVSEADFLALCEGRNPATAERLTARQNGRRQENGRSVANRRVFYDFTLSPPKSVSVVALMQDDRISAIHTRAVRDALGELEKLAGARVRKSGQHGERPTGNVVAATFRHDTSRELDPHLHTHCVMFNATLDPVEQRWKALEVQGMYRAQRFVENLYYHELAKGLRSLGYAIENNGRDFEIKGVPQSVVTRFSKRHEQIDAETRKRIEREGRRGPEKAIRRQVAEDKRRRKQKESTADRLRPLWRNQLSPAEAKALASVRPQSAYGPAPAEVGAAVAWADEHLFERRSVVAEHELLSAALARGRGENFGLGDLRTAVAVRDYVREAGTDRLTSREVLGYELEVVVAAHDGRGRHGVLAPNYRPTIALSMEQKTAVEKILGSRDFVTLFQGGAGTGKSFTLQEIERGLSAAGLPVVVLAPQRQQVSDLQADGLSAETLARFLQTKTLPRGAVVIVDEAGQIGGRQLRDLFRVVQAHAGRIILSGDTRQHGAVAASDALRAIEKHAGLKAAEIRIIRRQDPQLGATARERRFIRSYRMAVKAAAQGNIRDSFARLDRLGCIRELSPAERREALAADYLAAQAKKEKALVVAQTREEARHVNDSVRRQLRAAGQLGKDHLLTAYRPHDLGEAQKRDPRFYSPGLHVCFLRRYGRYAKGDLCEIAGADERGLVLLKKGRRSLVSYRYAKRFTVVEGGLLEIARGDRLQLKFNGVSAEGRPLNNGELVTVRRVLRDGSLTVTGDDGTRKTLGPSQRLLVRGYAVTSYGSQGKTVDTVLFCDAVNIAATNAEQWYVTVSRGRKRVVVFTSDKEALRSAVQHTAARELALDLKTLPIAGAAPAVADSLATVERLRHHQAVMAHVQRHDQRQRIAV